MKVSYSWLKDYVDVKVDPKKLGELLTMAGISVASYEKVGSDYIFEFEITSNRADCLSVIGIAREVAALLGKKLRLPKELSVVRRPSSVVRRNASIDIVLKDPDLCPRYTARIIKNVEVKPSPEWLKDRIISVGLRPINNIVDIINFVLFETGQPMHAFDLDKINGNVYVRRAKKNEKIITIDDTPRTCDENMLIIADENNPVAIAGVMGGKETEVSSMTKNILLESALFNPVSIRRTSRALGISSESSYRFERRIDNNMVLKASFRACSLINKLAGGEAGEIIDRGDKKFYRKTVDLDLARANSVLGTSISKAGATKILKSIGFGVKETKRLIRVTAPSFREDVKTEVDLTEEIARIYGYEKIPITVPRITGNVKIKDDINIIEEETRKILTRLGLYEIITYSLINKESLNGTETEEGRIITIKNPLSIDQEIMRPSMLPGIMKAISYNLNRKAKSLSFFELGKIYINENGTYKEKPVLAGGITGIKPENWKTQKEDFDFFDLKGIFEKLLSKLGISGFVFKKGKMKCFKEGVSSSVEYKGESIAHLGEAREDLCKKFDVEKKVFYGEIYIDKIIGKINLRKRYRAPSKYPPVFRDISVIADREVTSRAITEIIENAGSGLVKEISLIDYYKGRQIPEGKRGLLYRIEYRSDEKTLEDREIDKIHTEVKDVLSKKLGISFR